MVQAPLHRRGCCHGAGEQYIQDGVWDERQQDYKAAVQELKQLGLWNQPPPNVVSDPVWLPDVSCFA